MQYKVIVFDMDGVLVENDSSWVTIHNYFGVDNGKAFKSYLNGEIDYNEFMRRDIALWPKTNIEVIKTILNETKIIPGVKQTIEALKRKKYITVIVSAGLDILANKINRDLHIDYVFANSLDINEKGDLIGTGKCNVELLRKDQILIGLSKKFNIPLDQFVVVGDSRYDIPMLKVAGLAIAFNPKDKEIQKVADIIIEDDDISKILQPL